MTKDRTIRILRCTICNNWIGALQGAKVEVFDLEVGWSLRCRKCIASKAKAAKKMIKEVPEECPLINGCVKGVVEETFDVLCDSEDWIDCDTANHIAERMGFRKKPKQWKKEKYPK